MSVHAPLGATGTSGALKLSCRTASIGRRGALALATLVLGTLVLVVAAPATDALLPQSTRPIPSWLAGPFGGSGALGPAALIAVLMMLLLSYAVAVRLADRLPARALLGTIVALHALVMLAPPLLSTDVFSYQAYARMWTEYGINPYVHGPRAIALDPLYPFIGARWVATPSAYGPVFTLLSCVVGGSSIATAAVSFKALAALASLGTVALLWRAAPLRGIEPARAAALFGLNPLVVVYGVGGGHNDLLMLLAVAAALYAALAGRHRDGGALLALAAGLKLTAALVAPFIAAAPGGRRRELLVGASAVGLLIAAAAGAAFGTGPLRLPAIVAGTQSVADWHSIAGVIGGRLGLGVLGHVVAIALAVGFATACAWLLARVWRGGMHWLDAYAWAVLAMLLAAGSLMPWYLAWLLVPVALTRDERLWRTALALTGLVLALQLPDYVPHGTPLLGL